MTLLRRLPAPLLALTLLDATDHHGPRRRPMREGGFLFCGVPVDRWLEARAFTADAWHSAGVIRLMFIGFTERDLRVAP